MASQKTRASKRRRRTKAKLVPLSSQCEPVEKQLLCHASPKPNKVEMASEQACASKRQRQRQRRRRRKAKLSALLPSQPKPESVPLPSPPMPELVQLPDESEESEEPEESEDDNSSGDDGIKVTPTERDLESDEALWALYERWCLHHGKSRTPEEMQRRFSNFKKEAFHVFELNHKYFPCRFCMFRWTDETAEERKRRTPIPASWDRT